MAHISLPYHRYSEGSILLTMPNHSLPVSVMKDPVTWLYPAIEPYHTGRLQVSPVHELYFEESGNPSGKPVCFCMAVRAVAQTRNSADIFIRKSTA
jgi:hypothetical protein